MYTTPLHHASSNFLSGLTASIHKRTFPLAVAFSAIVLISGCATLPEPFQACATGGCTDDAQITAAVQANLREMPDSEPSLYVTTTNHVVYLHGATSTGLGAEIAESVARQTQGVQNVVNLVSVDQ